MTLLTEKEYNGIIKSGRSCLILLYDPSDARSVIMLETFRRIDKMIGRSFDVYTVDATAEKEIANVLFMREAPEVVFIADTHIKARSRGILTENEILRLTR